MASSTGVFFEDKQQLVYQHKLFNRLNWTNKEAWAIFPLNEKQLLLAESHQLLLVDRSMNETSVEPISDKIYPRELLNSRYNANLIFVITETDVQLLFQSKMNWQFKPLYTPRPISIIEEKSGSILLSTEGEGFIRIEIDPNNGSIIKKERVSSLYQFEGAGHERTALLQTRSQEIIAYNSSGIFKIEKGKAAEPILPQLTSLLQGLEINQLLQAEDGLFYGFTHFKFFHQDMQGKWHIIDLSQYLQGVIDAIRVINDEVKILSRGVFVSYINDRLMMQEPVDYTLRMTKISLKQQGVEQLLPIDSQQLINFNQGDALLTFSCVLNELKNYEDNQYRFQLQGESDQWSDYSNNNKIQISNITAGEYVSNIQTKDLNGKTYTMKGYQFVVNPPWYSSSTAKMAWIILALLLLTLLFNLLLKWREKIHEYQKKELKTIINNKTQQLEKANVSLQKMAHLDGLTVLSNRFYLDEFIKDLTHQQINNIVVMMMDMDEFKQFNDKNGHIAGDDLLKKTAQILMQAFDRPGDIIARYGGEEFLVIMMDCSESFALEKADEVRSLIENKEKKASISIGVCESSQQNDLQSLDAIYHLIDKADKALYDAKNTGRNKIVTCH